MEITINNQLKSIAEQSLSVQQLLDLELPGRQKGVAVALNNKVIPKSDWNNQLLSEKDQVLIIKATQGG